MLKPQVIVFLITPQIFLLLFPLMSSKCSVSHFYFSILVLPAWLWDHNAFMISCKLHISLVTISSSVLSHFFVAVYHDKVIIKSPQTHVSENLTQMKAFMKTKSVVQFISLRDTH